MKAYLHGPRVNQTIVFNGIQFTNGEADVEPNMFRYLADYHGARDYPPDGGSSVIVEDVIDAAVKEDASVVEDDSQVDGAELLRKITESRKEELVAKSKESDSQDLIDEMNTLTSWYKMKKFVKDTTGLIAMNKDEAIKILTEFKGKA